MNETLLSMEGITKSFFGVKALDQCKFELKAGEVHALIGENGAGKSTLMKILAGVYKRDGGVIRFQGKEIEVPNPKAAQQLGICIIHQELNLCPDLNAAQNIFIGREPVAKCRAFLNESAANARAREIFQKMRVNLDPRQRVGDMTVARQQMVEIAKALSFDSKILVMDEPTAALTGKEIEELFAIIRDLKQSGVGIVYISHRMEELFEISDRITVMRDGEYVGTEITGQTNLEKIISMMVGRTIYQEPRQAVQRENRKIALEARGLSRGKAVQDCSFQLYQGEILGFAGLMGAGRTELARLIFGADKKDGGEVYIRGQKVSIDRPSDAVRLGIGYLSEDRKRFGLNLGESLEENVSLAAYDKFCKYGFVNKKRTKALAQTYIDLLKIKAVGVTQLAKYLSGGNQQKVVIAKWLARDCDILIFDEPTRGIDVGAKNEIYKLLSQLAEDGKSIIMISSELPEILRMSDRVIVMCEGRITGQIHIAEATQETIMQYATRRDAQPA